MKLQKFNWFNITFISFTTLVAVIGAPIYILRQGLAIDEIVLFTVFALGTGLGITVGYHRLFAHATYTASRPIQFLLLFFGAAAFEQSALAWSSQHRDHHQFVDTERDPYNIKKGFFWAHMGWLIWGKYQFYYTNVEDLIRNRLVMNQAKYYPLWALAAGVVTPVLIGSLWGHALSGFILSVCLRVTLVYHSTWCINSVCHTFGNRTYDLQGTARDHWLVAFLTFGEGYHNFHHRFPSDYRNGVKWYHVDPSKWIIALWEKLGLVSDVMRVPEDRITRARMMVLKNSASSEKITAGAV